MKLAAGIIGVLLGLVITIGTIAPVVIWMMSWIVHVIVGALPWPPGLSK